MFCFVILRGSMSESRRRLRVVRLTLQSWQLSTDRDRVYQCSLQHIIIIETFHDFFCYLTQTDIRPSQGGINSAVDSPETRDG